MIAAERADEASAALERAIATTRERGTAAHVLSNFLQLLAAARLAVGDLEPAREAVNEAIAAARRYPRAIAGLNPRGTSGFEPEGRGFESLPTCATFPPAATHSRVFVGADRRCDRRR